MRIGMIAGPVAVCLMVLPAVAQPAPDPCKPIGRTEDGKLVYSLNCKAIPAPPKPAAASGDMNAAMPVTAEEEDKGGLFGRAPSFIRPTADPRAAGSGPAQPR